MNRIYLCIIATLLSWLCGNAQCITNGNFEGGLSAFPSSYTFTKLKIADTTYSFVDCHINTKTSAFGPLTPSTTLNNIIVAGGGFSEGVTLVSTASITPYGVNDPVLYNNGTAGATVSMPRVRPSSGGTYAVKLNGSNGGSDIVTMTSNFTASSAIISFDFSLIFQLHGADDVEPFFTARIYNAAGEIINENEICYKANVDNNIFQSLMVGSTNTLYTGWQCGRLQIPAAYVNKPLRLEFVVADCGASGHFGTAYLDNIRCDAACSAPIFGLLTLDQVNISCPSTPFSICGDFVAPLNAAIVPGSLKLDLIDTNDNVITNIPSLPVISGNTFCFTVDPITISQFSGNFEFRANADFLKPATSGSPAYTYNLFDASSNEGIDLTMNAINTQDATILTGGILTWPDIGDTYELEFVSDNTCCPGYLETSGRYYSVTLTDNHLDLFLPQGAVGAKCYRWRIKSNCGGWSDWCCLSGQAAYFFPNNFGNPIAPKCYSGDLSCIDTLYQTVNLPEPSGTIYSFKQREVSITAVNTLTSPGEAVYQANEFIELLPGFNAKSGSLFLAEIENCSPAEIIKAQPKAKRLIARDAMDVESTFDTVNENTVIIYPNPTDGLITIVSDKNIETYTIIDITGKELKRFNNTSKSTQMEINISEFSPGIYFLNANGIPAQKIIKN